MDPYGEWKPQNVKANVKTTKQKKSCYCTTIIIIIKKNYFVETGEGREINSKNNFEFCKMIDYKTFFVQSNNEFIQSFASFHFNPVI